MRPEKFEQANCQFGPPEDLDDSQCKTIYAFKGQVNCGHLDGSEIIIVAWKPSTEEIEQIQAGAMVFLTCIGGLPPHRISTSFQDAAS